MPDIKLTKIVYCHTCLKFESFNINLLIRQIICFTRVCNSFSGLLFIEDCLKFSEFETALVEKFPEQRGGPFLLAVRNKVSLNF